MQTLPLGSMYNKIKQSRDGANRVKRDEPVMVVIGNPPYVDKVKGSAPWIETLSDNRSAAPTIKAFKTPHNGRLEYVLANKYVYFWRWATWKAFDAHAGHPSGIVAMICSAGFTSGPGFAGMREYLRRTADEGWIIDLSPEGHQSPMETRVFRANQQPICIAVFIRSGEADRGSPARIFRTSVAGTLEEKCRKLEKVALDSSQWHECLTGWGDPLSTPVGNEWEAMPTTIHMMPWASPGVKPNRTWVYAPDEASLKIRWRKLVSASAEEKPDLFRESRDANLSKLGSRLAGVRHYSYPFSLEDGSPPDAVRVGYRSYDRQWLLPDSRIIATPRAPLWSTISTKQIFALEQHAHTLKDGPALTFTALLPDMDCFMGHHGGRALPLYRDSEGLIPNITPKLLNLLRNDLNCVVSAPDVVAYLAAVLAHPGYTKRFAAELKTPGVRVPITKDPDVWKRAVEVGREVLWLQTYGEREVDDRSGRPHRAPRLRARQPKVQVAIPDTEEGMPESISYNGATHTLHVGDGQISPVMSGVWNYQVSGMWVVKHWFGYRKKKPAGKRGSPLDDIVAATWTPAMTTELLDLLNVLGRCVELEPTQTELLDEIMDGPLITVSDLEVADVLPVPAVARKPPTAGNISGLWSVD